MTKTATLNKTTNTAPAKSAPLGLTVSLNFTDYSVNSEKFHKSILKGNTVYYLFGRMGTAGHEDCKTFESDEKAAAYYWNLLRDKVGKGYHVEGARVILANEKIVSEKYGEVQWNSLLSTNGSWLSSPELKGISPRTAKIGAKVILTLTDPNADEDALFDAAASGASERFLLPLVLSHPACPEETKVMNSLMKYGSRLQD